jgi:glycosyltransferase involved in cell wall biosynthesis
MLVTVGICTWNRAGLLRQALAALARVELPPRLEWEVLVVDNGSRDATPAVVREFRDRLPIRTVSEPEPGLSNARNRCVAQARGAYILWTDDDVLVEPGWLREYALAFDRFPAAAVFGGPVRARFEGERLPWIAAAWRDVQTAFGIRDLGDALARLDPDNLPFGSNYAVRRAEQLAHRYDPRLGRVRDEVLGGEEVAVLRAILRGGGEGWWLPGAAVDHWIPKRRQTPRYLRRYYRAQGRVLALHWPAAAERKLAVFGRPLWLWRQAIEAELTYRRSRMIDRPEQWVGHLVRASTGWGVLLGWRRAARE